MRAAGLLPLLLFGVGLVLAGPAEARIYKYVDRNGEAHYTDSLQQVPLEYRRQVRDISPEVDAMTGLRVLEGAGEDAGKRSADDAGGLDASLDTLDLEMAQLGDGSDLMAGLLESVGYGVILLVLLAIPVLYVVSALIFRMACRVAGEDPPSLGRACGILLAQAFAGGAAGAAVSGIAMAMGIDASASMGASGAVNLAGSLLSWMVNAAILSAMMSYGFLKSMWIGFLHTLLTLVMIGVPAGLLAFVGFLLA